MREAESPGQPTPRPEEQPRTNRPRKGLFYGWWVAISSALAQVGYAEQFNSSFGVFLGVVSADMGWSRTAVAAVQTVGRFPEALLAPFLGPIVDRHGARWFVGFGALVVGGCFMAMATMDHLWQLYVYKAVLMPIGALCLGGFLSVTVSNWFVAYRGRALGLSSAGNSFGTMVMPLLAAFLIAELGWREAWFILGPTVILFAIPAVVLFRRRPEDLGMVPDGPGAAEDMGPHLDHARERRRQALLAADVEWTRGQILRTPALWIMVFSWSFSGMGITGTNLHLVPYLQDLGYALTLAAGAISLRAAVSLFTAPVWGIVMDRVPILAGATAEQLLKAFAMLAFLLYPTPVGIVAGLILYGLGNAGSMVVHESIWANYYGRLSLGTVRSLVAPLQMASSAAGPLVLGLLYEANKSYEFAWFLLSLGFFIAALLVQFARPPRHPAHERA